MGIQDRDYMRERSRKAAHEFEARRYRPFTPPREGASTLVSVVTWIAAAFILYHFYGWLVARHREERAPARDVVVTNIHRDEPTREQISATQQIATPNQVRAQPHVQRMEAAPPMQPQPSQEERRDAPPPQTAGTIYLCKSYNGGTFWAQAHCAQHHALIDSIVPVPIGLPFEQQVQLAEQRRQPTVVIHETTVNVNAEPAGSGRGECKALDARVDQLDSMARQPQPAQMQDWIRGQRREARDRQFALHC